MEKQDMKKIQRIVFISLAFLVLLVISMTLSDTLSITIISPENTTYYIYSNSSTLNLNFSLSVTNLSEADSCWYNLYKDSSLEITNTTINCTINSTTLNISEGLFTLNLYANDSTGNLSLASVNFSVIFPLFFNFTENPSNNTAYTSQANYKFSVTIKEINISDIWIEWLTGNQSINYTDWNITNISNTYSFNLTDLSAGTYSYKWWLNYSDTINSSDLRYYTIAKASRTLTITFSPSTINETTPVNISCSVSAGENDGTLGLYRDGIDVTGQNSQLTTFDAGSYQYTCNITEGSNYSSATTQSTLTVESSSSSEESSTTTTETSTTETTETTETTKKEKKIDILNIRDLRIKKGQNKSMEVKLKNTGDYELKNCIVLWYSNLTSINITELNNTNLSLPNLNISSKIEKINLIGIGKITNLTLSIDTEEAEIGRYDITLKIDCENTTDTENFNVNIIEKAFSINITNITLKDKEVSVSYIIKELADTKQNISLKFVLSNKDGKIIANLSESLIIKASSSLEKDILLNLSEETFEELSLKLIAESKEDSLEISKPVFIKQSSKIGGFAIALSPIGRIGIAIIILLLIFVILYIFIRRARNRKIAGLHGMTKRKDKIIKIGKK